MPDHCKVDYFLTPFQNLSHSHIGRGDTLNFDVAAHTEKIRAMPTETAINANGQLKYINSAGGEYKVRTTNSGASFASAATATSSEIAQYKIMATRVAKARSHLSVADENGNVTIEVRIVCQAGRGYCEEGNQVTIRLVTVELEPTGVDALPTRVSAQSNLAKPRKAPAPTATFTPTPTPTPTQIVIDIPLPEIIVEIEEEEPVSQPQKEAQPKQAQPQKVVEKPVAPPTATNTPVPPTNTPVPTATKVPAPTATNTPVSTPTATPETVDTDEDGSVGCVSSAEYAAAASKVNTNDWMNEDSGARFKAMRAAYLANPC